MGGGAASGKVGAMVGGHNAGGQYLRARTTPTNPKTLEQQAVRNAVTTLASRWNETVTFDQQTAWKTYAVNVPVKNRLGDTITLSGISMYVRSNVSRIQSGLPIQDDAPLTYNLGQLPNFDVPNPAAGGTAFTLTLGGGTDQNTWNSEANATTNSMLVYASRPMAGNINFFAGPYRLAASFPGGNTTGTFTGTLPFPAGNSNSQLRLQARISYGDGRLSGAYQQVAFPV